MSNENLENKSREELITNEMAAFEIIHTNKQGIYCILYKPTGKRYVGSTIQSVVRVSCHRSRLNRKIHNNPILQNYWNKYGEKCFSFYWLETVANKDDLNNREDYWMDKFDTLHPKHGFNLHPADRMTRQERSRIRKKLYKIWLRHFNKVKLLDRCPSQGDEFYHWCGTQRARRAKLSSKQIALLNSIHWWYWTAFDRRINLLAKIPSKHGYQYLKQHYAEAFQARRRIVRDFHKDNLSQAQIDEVSNRIIWWDWRDVKVKHIHNSDVLTISKIVQFIKEFKETNGKYPHKRSGNIPNTQGDTWATIESALRYGSRGLKDDPLYNCKSLGILIEQHFPDFTRKNNYPLTVNKILHLVNNYITLNGKLPNTKSGYIKSDNHQEKWVNIHLALKKGRRQIIDDPNYSPDINSLQKLIKKFYN